MSKLQEFKSCEIKRDDLLKLTGGDHPYPCQHYENLCMQTAYNNGNLFLLDDCDALCDANGNWN
jgi:hypothetical protein